MLGTDLHDAMDAGLRTQSCHAQTNDLFEYVLGGERERKMVVQWGVSTLTTNGGLPDGQSAIISSQRFLLARAQHDVDDWQSTL